jgi:hypothetical protein
MTLPEDAIEYQENQTDEACLRAVMKNGLDLELVSKALGFRLLKICRGFR